MIIKRKRGHRDGYIILAPFVVHKRVPAPTKSDEFTLNTKYMLNLGWVPMESKHKIRECAADDIL
jgi:hypothetical protein